MEDGNTSLLERIEGNYQTYLCLAAGGCEVADGELRMEAWTKLAY